MDNKTSLNRFVGVLILRVLLGLIFLMQGYGKVFKFGVSNIYSGILTDYQNTFLPKWLLCFTAYYTSYIELIFGLLLVFGAFSRISLYLLGSVLIVISFGHGLIEPIWDLHHLFFRACMLIGLLLLPSEWNKYSLDHLLFRKNKIVK